VRATSGPNSSSEPFDISSIMGCLLEKNYDSSTSIHFVISLCCFSPLADSNVQISFTNLLKPQGTSTGRNEGGEVEDRGG
jgi:hypothetical protein